MIAPPAPARPRPFASALAALVLLAFGFAVQAAHRPAGLGLLQYRAGAWIVFCTAEGMQLGRADDPALPRTPEDAPYCPICLTLLAGPVAFPPEHLSTVPPPRLTDGVHFAAAASESPTAADPPHLRPPSRAPPLPA